MYIPLNVFLHSNMKTWKKISTSCCFKIVCIRSYIHTISPVFWWYMFHHILVNLQPTLKDGGKGWWGLSVLIGLNYMVFWLAAGWGCVIAAMLLVLMGVWSRVQCGGVVYMVDIIALSCMMFWLAAWWVCLIAAMLLVHYGGVVMSGVWWVCVHG